MRTREWQRIERALDPEPFQAWLKEQPTSAEWSRDDTCCCPLHDYVEDATGRSISINSPELHEHWATRETQEWPAPWWVTWFIRSIAHVGEGNIGPTEAIAVLAIGIERDWRDPLMSPGDLAEAMNEER